MSNIANIVSLAPGSGLAGYLKSYRDLQRELKKGTVSAQKSLKIALLSSFTAVGLRETLAVKCAKLGVLAEVYVGEYSRCQQELIDPGSKLYQFAPDVLFVFFDTRSILGELFFFPYRQTAAERREWVEDKVREVMALIEAFRSRSPAMVVLHNFELPVYSPLGIHESKQDYGFVEAVQDLNGRLRSACRHDAQIHLLDYDAFCAAIGKRRLCDAKMYYWADIRLAPQHLAALCDQYLAYLRPRLGLARKCIVLDLDGTLWGGIIGEDGLGGITLGPTPEGRPYWEFQKHLLALLHRGVILAINSKNNPADALMAIREHPYMVLREAHFAAMQINWADKITNLEAISNELNIGLDALVFFDDDKANREMVKAGLPEVLVVDLPEDASQYVPTLLQLDVFDTLQITEEDLNRGQLYAARRQRPSLESATTDISGYLKALEMTVAIQKATAVTIPRISQLTQKTNQFNMTTRRYTEEDIRRFAETNNHLVACFAVTDRFGDNGIVGAVVVKRGAGRWRIDTFLLSCRVIGRRLEHVMLSYILNQARTSQIPLVVGEFIPTKRNQPASGFFREQGFALANQAGGSELWEWNMERTYQAPEYIKVFER